MSSLLQKSDSHSIFSNDKVRGAFTTVISGSVAGLAHFLGVYLGFDEVTSSIFSFYILGSIVAYTLDIIFAKQTFPLPSGKIQKVAYSEFVFRMKWLLRSFVSMYFYRFIITIIIDTIIGLSILSSLLEYLDKIHIDFYLRDTLMAGLVALFTFVLFNNVLRFDWAYEDEHNIILDFIVFMWVSLVLVIFSFNYKAGSSKSDKSDEK